MGVQPLSLPDRYMRVLEHLSTDDKLDLIIKLVNSVRNDMFGTSKPDKPNKEEIFASFSGEWHDIETNKDTEERKNRKAKTK